YAEAAARTGAEWALLCRAQCKVGLKQFDEANDLYQSSAIRYPANSTFEWYLACRASGKMDIVTAEKEVRAVIERAGDRMPQRMAWKAGCYYLAIGKKDKALAALAREDSLYPN